MDTIPIRRVARGAYRINDRVLATPAVAARMLARFRDLTHDSDPEVESLYIPLSPREIEVLGVVARPQQQGDRHDPGHQRSDGQEPHHRHHAQARGQRPDARRRLRLAPRVDHRHAGRTTRRGSPQSGARLSRGGRDGGCTRWTYDRDRQSSDAVVIACGVELYT